MSSRRGFNRRSLPGKNRRRGVVGLPAAILSLSTILSLPVQSLVLSPTLAQAAGTTWYVGPGGSDGNACSSQSTACATVNGAISHATAGDTISIAAGTYTGNVTVDRNVTLAGAGARSTTLDGNNSGTVVTINSGVTATVQDLTIQGGNPAGGFGGGVLSGGTLTVVRTAIVHNSAQGGANVVGYGGAGIAVGSGTVTVRQSTIAFNTTNAFGAGMYITSGASATIVDSTIANNTDSAGGGGSGVITWGTATLYVSSSTIANNSGSTTGGNGIYNYGSATVKSTIVANNDCRNDNNGGTTPGSMTDAGNNIDSGTGCGFTSASSRQSTDPQFTSATPTANGGPTDTFVPSAGSPAIENGSCTDISGNVVKTDQRGASRPASACTIGALEADQANDTWPNAILLGNTSSGGAAYQVDQTMNQYIYAPNQVRWYRFPVTPGSKVHISYTGSVGATVSLHTDLPAAYNAVAAPTNAAVASAIHASSGYLPQQYLPLQDLPQQYLPQQYLPQQYLPHKSLPQQYLPPKSLPQQYLPQQYLPQQYLPGPYTGAVDASLLTLSAIPNATTQTIDHFTWNSSGYFYVRVSGPVDSSSPFQVTVTETLGVCGGSSPVTAIPATQPVTIATGLTSLILWDSSRIGGSSSDISTLRGKLSTFAARSEVNGAVIDLSQNSGVESSQAQADNNAGCPAAKNIVANDIKSVIQAYRAQNPGLQYIVIAGDDRSIPYFRYPDVAGLGPENQYYPPVGDTSASNASLRDNYVLGQDEYGASVDLPISDLSLPIPDRAVGRLVSTASDVSHMLDVYSAANGTLKPSSALVSGYDFVADAACGAQGDLTAGMPAGSTVDTLIQPGTQPLPSSCPTRSTAWTAGDMSQKLLSGRHDIVFMAGHFSAGALEASDYATSLSAAAVASSSVDMSGTLVLALGCHGGYTIPGSDSVPNFSPSPDWPQAFAQKGASLLAETGYAYGDTDFTEYGEHLFDNYAKQLRTYSGASYVPVATGKAEVAAKQEYLKSHTNLSGVDEKTLLETAFYGLPMMTVNMTGQTISTSSDTSVVSSAPTVASGPGVQFQLGQSPDVDLMPSLTSHSENLTNGATGSSVTTTYLTGPNNGLVARPGEPIFPSQVYNVGVPGQILRGVGFVGGSYSDTSNVTPLTSAAGTETGVGHPAFYSNVFYPTQVWTPNFFDAINGGAEHLATTPAQYISSGPGSTSGTLRQFSHLQFRLFYLPSGWTSNATTTQAAVAAASTISSVSATADTAGNVTFSVHVLSDQSAGTQGVWITYTSPSSGTWQSINLTQSSSDPTLWTASQPLPGGSVFMVQAVNGTGLVSLSTNSGAYYTVGSPTPPAAPAPTTISLQSPPTSGPFQSSGTFRVLLQSGGAPLANQVITVQVGGRQDFGMTGTDGVATVNVPLEQAPGTYDVIASFAGSSGYQASTQAASGGFQITAAPTNLRLTASGSGVYGGSAPVTATLQDGSGNGLMQKSVVFTVTGNGITYRKSVITDVNGAAQLGSMPIPAGSYSVNAAFGGVDQPLTVTIGSSTVTQQDPNYLTPAAPAAVPLTINPAPLTITAGNGSMIYGQAAPAITPSFNGFVNGDGPGSLSAQPTCATTATSISPVGTYASSCQNAAAPNYTIGYAAGTVTVGQAGTTTTDSGTNVTYGQTSVPLSAAVTANAPSTAVVNEGSVLFQLTQNGSNVGNAVTSNVGNGAASANYALPAGAVGTYTVNATYKPAATTPNFTGSATTSPSTMTVQYVPDKTNGVANTCNGDLEHAILQPVNPDGSSVFKQGSTVPLKFRVCDVKGVSIGTAGVVTSFVQTGTSSDPSAVVDESTYSGTPDTAFRWDSTGQQWIFNLSTKNLTSATTYYYKINLNDGTAINFHFAVR